MSYRFLLVVSLVTGMASFCYEIGWLRMLSLVLGASTHAFELMLSSFILGLALGGLWIKRRVERATDPSKLLAVIQVAMGLLALMTLFVYGRTFDWMSVVMNTFTRTESGYTGFNWASHAIASLLMLPATFCAGMTLPVITYAALRAGAGERAIGGVYAANTVGAIAGIVLATHVLMPAFNAKGVIFAGAAMDFGLGLLLFAKMAPPARVRRVAAAAVIGVVAFTFTFLAANVDPLTLTSGVFRYGFSRSSQDEVLYLRDGKTANVSVSRRGSEVSLATNGKFDASINLGYCAGLHRALSVEVRAQSFDGSYHHQYRRNWEHRIDEANRDFERCRRQAPHPVDGLGPPIQDIAQKEEDQHGIHHRNRRSQIGRKSSDQQIDAHMRTIANGGAGTEEHHPDE